MKLSEIYDQLAYGELRQLAIGDGPLGDATAGTGIPAASYSKILPFVKQGLTEIHKRMLLKEKTMTVTLQTDQLTYLLGIGYAVSNTSSTLTPKYITDTVAVPFEDDLMRIERVYGTLDAVEYKIPMNEIDNVKAIRTPSYDTLIIPSDTDEAPWLLETTTLRVVYRADHPVISTPIANAAPSVVDIFLPRTHVQALVWYVASRLMNPKGLTNEFHEGNNYFMKFEAEIASLKTDGMQVDTLEENYKLDNRGFA